MKRLIVALGVLAAGPALAQPADPHAGHRMPAQTPAQPAPATDPHAGHHPTPAPAPAATPDPHAGHVMPPAGTSPTVQTGLDLPVGTAAAPPPAADNLADRLHGVERMDAARAVLRGEHGGMRLSRTMIDTLEVRPDKGPDVYAWEAEFRYGGDIDRLVMKTEGEGEFGHGLESAEVQALWSHAVGPYFDLQAGVRQDFQPHPRRTYAVVGFEGLAPYWFDVEGALFLSNKGDLSARIEGSYDLRLTQRLILQPRVEANMAAQNVPELGVGAGLSDAEVGLRLRYEIYREFAPYIGVNYERKFGDTADFARAAGEARGDLRAVAGVRIWF
jgi:copper resistance protein B